MSQMCRGPNPLKQYDFPMFETRACRWWALAGIFLLLLLPTSASGECIPSACAVAEGCPLNFGGCAPSNRFPDEASCLAACTGCPSPPSPGCCYPDPGNPGEYCCCCCYDCSGTDPICQTANADVPELPAGWHGLFAAVMMVAFAYRNSLRVRSA